MAFKSKYLNPQLPEKFEGVERSGDRLKYRVGSLTRIAKASLSRLLTQFQKNVDFCIITPVHYTKSAKENMEAFRQFPALFRSLAGTAKVGAYELVGHWLERNDKGEEVDQTEPSWFIVNGDPNLSSDQFYQTAKILADRYSQTAFIIRKDGKTTLETPSGEVWATFSTDGAIENAWEKMLKQKAEFQKGERPGVGYSELKRLKDKGRGSPVVLDNAPEEAEPTTEAEIPEVVKTSSQKPRIFVCIPGSLSDRRTLTEQGISYPDWEW